jgi:hypothetical protein
VLATKSDGNKCYYVVGVGVGVGVGVVKLAIMQHLQIATGLPYSESPRRTLRSGPILIKIRCDLVCSRPVESFDLLGWASSPHSAFKNCTLGGGPVPAVLFVARAHQPTLRVDLRVDGLHQPTLNIQSAVHIYMFHLLKSEIVIDTPGTL